MISNNAILVLCTRQATSRGVYPAGIRHILAFAPSDLRAKEKFAASFDSHERLPVGTSAMLSSTVGTVQTYGRV